MDSEDANNQLRSKWEERASSKADTFSSVLFQGFPDHLNHWIHDYHKQIIENHFIRRLPNHARVLDVGCGYGRISDLVLRVRPDIDIIGLDFSLNYCKLYRRNIEAGVICGDISSLPLSNNSVDGILAVTSLMYVAPSVQTDIIRSFSSLLRPGGILLIIDPGLEFMNTMRRLRPGIKKSTTGGSGFTKSDYTRLASNAGMEILESGGMPTFSLLLPVLFLLSGNNILFNRLFSGIMKADVNYGGWLNYTLHRWILVRRLRHG